MKTKLFLIPLIIAATLLCPTRALAGNEEKAKSLKDLQSLLKDDYIEMEMEGRIYLDDIAASHEVLQAVIDENDNLQIQLYNQNPYFTLNLSWILKAITNVRNRFYKIRDRYMEDIVFFDSEIERYDLLLQSLQQREVDPGMEECLDSCQFYVAGILNYHTVVRDSLVIRNDRVQQADSLVSATNDYAQGRYKRLQDYVFKEGQDSWLSIFKYPDYFKMVLQTELKSQYSMDDLTHALEGGDTEKVLTELGYKAENTLLFYVGSILAFSLIPCMLLVTLLTCLCARIFKIGKKYKRIQIITFGLILGCCVALMLLYFRARSNDIFMIATYRMLRNYVWMLLLILASLLIRVKPQQLKASLLIYLPTVLIALAVFVCRICFMPDLLITLILAPVSVLFCILQLIVCLRYFRRVDSIDAAFGWIALATGVVALAVSIPGYTFASILIILYWFFQMTVLLCVQCLAFMIRVYQEKRMNPRIEKYHERVAAITGLQKDSLLFNFTWFYELMAGVVLPGIIIFSLPFCLQFTLNVFDFNELFRSIYYTPFIDLKGQDGVAFFTLSFRSIVLLAFLFCVFRYLNKLLHSLWQACRYRLFRRKYHRTTIRSNEINLSLDNSIISVIVWLIYITIFVLMLKIPVGSLTLIAGGLSAGIGLAMKDIINNFFCGIQLMSGRLRVGDYIECDGSRGRVMAIGYQSSQIMTFDDSVMVFNNSTLFNKNYQNLSRGSAYERVKIFFPLSYGTDIEKVRTLLLNAIKTLQSKDRFHRDVVDPTRDTRFSLYDFGERGIEVAIFQHVLVEERGRYMGKAKELIYKTLMDNGIHIPAHQIEVQLNPESSPEGDR